MRVLVAIELNDDDLREAYGVEPTEEAIDWDDLCAALDARAEIYCGPTNAPVRPRVLAVGDVSGHHALFDLLDCAEVGVDGLEPDRAAHILGTLMTMREHAEEQNA